MRFIFLLISILCHTSVWAQVENNAIRKRLTLDVDGSWVSSSTVNSSVEWDCINKALTKTCLVYHNDQWFTFQVPQPGKYFLNFKSQHCEKKLGIQVLLLEGDPCKTTTYELRKCISKMIQEDAYVVLDSLKTGMPYLINIDGFLGDFCSFDIQVSTRPAGFPFEIKTIDRIETEVTTTTKIVHVPWSITQKQAEDITHFFVYRKFFEQQRRLYTDVPINRGNAYGVVQQHYEVYDTLKKPGVYVYQIFGMERSGELVLVAQQQTNLLDNKIVEAEKDAQYKVSVPIKFSKGERIHIEIYDGVSGRSLSKETTTIQSGQKTLSVDFKNAIISGYVAFQLLISDDKRKKMESTYYHYSKSGGLKPQ